MIGRMLRDIHIQSKDKFARFIRMLNIRPKVKKKIFLKLANTEKDEEEEKS